MDSIKLKHTIVQNNQDNNVIVQNDQVNTIKKIAKHKLPDNSEHLNSCKVIEEQFAKVAKNIWKMADVLGGYARNEIQMKNFEKSDKRLQIAALIDECKAADSKALEGLKLLVNSL